MAKYIALDLGAESGRVTVATLAGGRLELEEVYRFPNGAVQVGESLYWDVLRLWDEIKRGLGMAAAEHGGDLHALAVDTWGIDYALLNRAGDPVKTHNVQVNAPLRHRGYRFFQATASQTREGFGISGISVTRNPGVNFMYLGYTVLTAGVCYLFFVRPIIDRRRRRQRREEAAES